MKNTSDKRRLKDSVVFRYILNTFAAAIVFALIMALCYGGVFNAYQSGLVIQIGIYIILASSLNMSAGYLGQLPLGHAGFMSVGAYTAALFSIAADLSPGLELFLALLIGGSAAGIFGIVIGLPALRLKGDYLAIITLGFGEVIRVIIQNLKITGGAAGLRGIQKHTTVFAVAIAVAVTLFIIHTIIKSRHGRAILAIREDEIAAEASGIPTTYYKVLTFAVSAFFAGVAGGLYAHYLSILDAANFGFMKSVEILVMVVLGGLGSMIGSVVAATGLTVLPELLREFSDYRMVIYSLLLVIVMIFKPSGLFGRYSFSLVDSFGDAKNAIKNFINKIKKKGAKEQK